MMEQESAKLRLPSIKRIKIDKVTASDSELNSFLQNWTPEQLELFWMNRNIVRNEEVKAEFYLDSLWKMLQTVSKEVYLWGILLNTSAFEQVVKSASNSERLVLRWCEISCSSALDFSTSSQYNINFFEFHKLR